MAFLSNIWNYLLSADPDEQLATIDRLPADVIRYIAKDLPISNVFKLCRTSRAFNNAVCSDKPFWVRRAQQDLTDDIVRLNTMEVKDLKKALYMAEAVRKDYTYNTKTHWLGQFLPGILYVDVTNVLREDGKQTADYYLAKDGYEKFIRKRVEEMLPQLNAMSSDERNNMAITTDLDPRNILANLLRGIVMGDPQRYSLVREVFPYLPWHLRINLFLTDAVRTRNGPLFKEYLPFVDDESLREMEGYIIDQTLKQLITDELQQRN